MGLPAEQPDNAAQSQPRQLPEILPSSPRGARASACGGGRGVQPPLLVDTRLLEDNPPSPARQDRREEVRLLLASLGVRKAYVLARDHSPEHIEGWVAAWQEDQDAGADIGPGALAMRIEQWGPPPTTSVLAAVAQDDRAEWLRRRYERGGRGSR